MTTSEMLKKYGAEVSSSLETYIADGSEYSHSVFDAMRYSLMNGGKRIRPALVLEFARINGLSDMSAAMPFACAIEMIHTYSLIHDDLPCMDNDDLRRGKPSCHVAFGEDIALLAGDALLSLAFETASKADFKNISPENVVKCINELAFASGAEGMVGGQVIDLLTEGKEISEDTLKEMHFGKTGRMIICAAKMGCICANADAKALEAATEYAHNIGRVFQIVDDILDITGDEKILGKPIGSDAANSKTTYATLLGVDGAFALASELTEKAKESLQCVYGDSADALCGLADMLLNRKN